MEIESRKSTVLIVDDNKNNLKVIASALNEKNYSMAFATSAKEALIFLENSLPDIILLDIMMPEMSGIELCRILKNDNSLKHIPIIFLTAKNAPADLEEAFDAGGADYITKPFSYAELYSRLQNQLQLKYATDNLNKTIAFKDKIMSIIAHDLRGPLGSVVTTLDLMADKRLRVEEENKQELMSMLKLSANGAYDLLENLLQWSRAESGAIRPEFGEYSLQSYIDNTLATVSFAMKEKNIQFHMSGCNDALVYGDIKMIDTVLRNLLSNAIKFTPEGGTIKLSFNTQGSELTIAVEDSGIGMDPETQSKVMDSKNYFSTYGTNNEKGSGLGIGLCVDFVHLMNGRIWVESSVGKGSCFYIVLPATNQTEGEK